MKSNYNFSVLRKHLFDIIQNTTGFSPGDPNSYSRPELVKTTHIHLDLDVDFDNQILVGTCTLSMEKVDRTGDKINLRAC